MAEQAAGLRKIISQEGDRLLATVPGSCAFALQLLIRPGSQLQSHLPYDRRNHLLQFHSMGHRPLQSQAGNDFWVLSGESAHSS